MQPEAFSAFRFPKVSRNGILCVGLQLEADETWLTTVLPFVLAGEHRRAQSFVRVMDAIRHLVGRALVRRVLQVSGGGALPGDFAATPGNKPSLPGTDVDFSISHSGGMLWAAFCRGAAVGIDVEEVREIPDVAALFSQFHPGEAAAIRAFPDAERTAAFYRCWTRKEAFLKATGEGLLRPLDSFQVDVGPDKCDWIANASTENPTKILWTSHDIDCGTSYQCSVVASAPHLELAIFIA